jgi:hypothetical protein
MYKGDNANRRFPVSHKYPPGDLNPGPSWREANRESTGPVRHGENGVRLQALHILVIEVADYINTARAEMQKWTNQKKGEIAVRPLAEVLLVNRRLTIVTRWACPPWAIYYIGITRCYPLLNIATHWREYIKTEPQSCRTVHLKQDKSLFPKYRGWSFCQRVSAH